MFASVTSLLGKKKNLQLFTHIQSKAICTLCKLINAVSTKSQNVKPENCALSHRYVPPVLKQAMYIHQINGQVASFHLYRGKEHLQP